MKRLLEKLKWLLFSSDEETDLISFVERTKCNEDVKCVISIIVLKRNLSKIQYIYICTYGTFRKKF